MSGETILVTGGAGYIGSHCCKALARAGYQPVVLDNLVYGHEEAVRWGPLENGDLANRGWVDSVMAWHMPAAVIHFAAYTFVGESMTDPGKYYANNTSAALGLIESCVAHGVKAFVFSSTAATYGIPHEVPIRESAPLVPINPYGRSKLMVEQILDDFDRAHGLRSIALRYFNASGADPDGELGESHDPETHLIPLALEAAAGRRPALVVNGEDYPTPDGTCIRDYIHVTDLAEAHVRALDLLLQGGASDRINLGTGNGASIREVLDTIARVTGHEVPHTMGARREGDPPSLVADATRAREVLGWQARMSDLDNIIATAWAWLQSGGHQKQYHG